MKIFFLGTPKYVQPIKQALAKNFTLVESLDDADLAVVASYGRILTENELNTPKYGCINVHPSLLPKYRGSSPIQAAILNKDKVSGITIIKLDEKVDHGPIIYRETLELSDDYNFQTLSKKIFQRAADILPKIIKDFVSGKITTTPQNDGEATYCGILTRASGFFDINNPPSSEKLDRMIRAYYPWPGVWTKWRVKSQESRVKEKIVKFLPAPRHSERSEESNLYLQMEGKKPISFKDFLNGYPDFPLNVEFMSNL